VYRQQTTWSCNSQHASSACASDFWLVAQYCVFTSSIYASRLTRIWVEGRLFLHLTDLLILDLTSMITEAIVVSKPGAPFRYQKVELHDELRPHEALIRIKATGVCHTDLNFSKEASMPDLFPGVLGHEGAGIVERVGSGVTKVVPGDHVIVVFSCCGECKYCLRKQSSYCDLWFQYNFGIGRLDGSKVYSSPDDGKRITSHFFGQSSFAKHILVSQNGLVKVDKQLPFEKLAPLGCGVMTGAGGKNPAYASVNEVTCSLCQPC
jgi:Zn-dependent alcohol dehydrogenase